MLGMLRLSELNHDEALKIGKLGGCRRGDDECERESVQRYEGLKSSSRLFACRGKSGAQQNYCREYYIIL